MNRDTHIESLRRAIAADPEAPRTGAMRARERLGEDPWGEWARTHPTMGEAWVGDERGAFRLVPSLAMLEAAAARHLAPNDWFIFTDETRDAPPETNEQYTAQNVDDLFFSLLHQRLLAGDTLSPEESRLYNAGAGRFEGFEISGVSGPVTPSDPVYGDDRGVI